jgi:hypothetical protein
MMKEDGQNGKPRYINFSARPFPTTRCREGYAAVGQFEMTFRGSSLFSVERWSPILVARLKRLVTVFGWSSWCMRVQAVPTYDGGKIGQKFHSPTWPVGGKIQIPALPVFKGICF